MQRLNTFFLLQPHIKKDSIKTPEALISFPWEEEQQKKRKPKLYTFEQLQEMKRKTDPKQIK